METSRKKFVDAAKEYLSRPYRNWKTSGNPSNALTCYDLVHCAAQDIGCFVPSHIYDQLDAFPEVALPQPGDLLLCMNPRGKPNHIGILVGHNHIVHSAKEYGGVVVTPITVLESHPRYHTLRWLLSPASLKK